MGDVPEQVDYPTHWQWPLVAIGVALFGVGYLLHPGWLSYCVFLLGAGALGWSRILGLVSAQRAWEASRGELARGEREYLWQAAYRWIRGRLK